MNNHRKPWLGLTQLQYIYFSAANEQNSFVIRCIDLDSIVYFVH